MEKIAAVVVTNNRIHLLKKIITLLRSQTRKLDEIIVVNNASTDGTKDWLDKQNDLTIIHQRNLGSSGGQYYGMKTAYENGNEYIWCMDDDIFPERDCLEKLLFGIRKKGKIVAIPLRKDHEGNSFYIEGYFEDKEQKIKRISDEYFFNEKFPLVETFTFEGPLFHRSVIDEVGLPNKDFFIILDDFEYAARINRKFGRKAILYCKDAIVIRQIPINPPQKIEKHFLKKKIVYEFWDDKNFWKVCYGKRNSYFLNRSLGWHKKNIKQIFIFFFHIYFEYFYRKKYNYNFKKRIKLLFFANIYGISGIYKDFI